jgi:ribokinase
MDREIVVLGGANADYLIRGERLPGPGETVEGEVFDEAPGGKGANQAVAAARLGASVAMVGRVGADARGDLLLGRLDQEGVDTRHVGRDAEAGTGVALIVVDASGQKQIAAAPLANARVGRREVQAAADLLQRCRVLLVQLELPEAAVEEGVAIADSAGARVVMDPAPARPLGDPLIARLDVIRPNAREAELLTGIEVRDFATAQRAAEALLARGAGAAIVEAGDEGNLVLTGAGAWRFPRFQVDRVDATGAGDAFAAAVAVGLARGLSWPDIGALASAAAALKTKKLGAQAGLPTWAAVETFLRERGVALGRNAAGGR